MSQKTTNEQSGLNSCREKCRTSIDCPDTGALRPEAETRTIPLIVRERSAAKQGCNFINVPSTWTQQELKNHIRCLYGYSSIEKFALTLCGKSLREPNTRLCDSKVSRYGLLLHDSISLLGGSDSVAEEEALVRLPPSPAHFDDSRHGMSKLNLLTGENDQEEEKKDDDAGMNLNSTLKDIKVESYNEIANHQQSSVCDQD